MESVADELREEGISEENICFFDLDDKVQQDRYGRSIGTADSKHSICSGNEVPVCG
jgi:hypothetical protein